MEKRFFAVAGILVVILIALVVIFSRLAGVDGVQGAQVSPGAEEGSGTETPSGGRSSTDPQRLMIPRWFLTSLTLEGQSFEVPEASMSLQFEEGGQANGAGGCNDFFSDYQIGEDGAIQFGPVGATKMFCDGAMDGENAYFEALSKVTRFKTEDWKLFLSSADGKTSLVFSMPPK